MINKLIMKEILIILLIIVSYFFGSYKLYFVLSRLKLFLFLLVSGLYIFLTYLFFDEAIHFHNHLRNKGIYVEFGHADELLVITFLLCLVIAFFTITLSIRKAFKPACK